MKAYRLLYPVKLMARVLEVSRSGYYTWLRRRPSRREIQDSVLKGLIRCAHKRSRGTYGPLRLQEELAAENQQVGRDHICRLRKEMGLKCIQHKKFKVTTDSQHHLPVAANLLEQQFSVSLPSTVWGIGYYLYRHRRRMAVPCGGEGFRNSRDRRLRHGWQNDDAAGAGCPEKGTAIQKAIAWLHSPFRSRKPILCRRVSQGRAEGGNDCLHVAKGKLL